MRPTAVLLLALASGGCALFGNTRAERAAEIEPLLTAAGFQGIPADTPEKLERLRRLEPLRLRYSTRGGKAHYWYADPYRCKCLYTGDQAMYDRYEALLVQRQYATEERAAATEREDATSIDREMDGWLPPDEVMWGEAPAATPELIEP